MKQLELICMLNEVDLRTAEEETTLTLSSDGLCAKLSQLTFIDRLHREHDATFAFSGSLLQDSRKPESYLHRRRRFGISAVSLARRRVRFFLLSLFSFLSQTGLARRSTAKMATSKLLTDS